MSNYTSTFINDLKKIISNYYIDQSSNIVDMIFIAYILQGHILLEGPPGTGKTMLTRVIAKILGKQFKRIQFTSDMLPSDIIGGNIYSPKTHELSFLPGPIFADFILADEINRTPPRTQSALLEAMEEKQVTIEGVTKKLPKELMVIATQNSLEYEGTFPLPEAQTDRFLFKILLSHLDTKNEVEIFNKIINKSIPPNYSEIPTLEVDRQKIELEYNNVSIDNSLLTYVSNILAHTRKSSLFAHGASVRGGISLINSSRVFALINNREHVIPDDIKYLAPLCLGHRVRLSAEAQVSGVSVEQAIIESVSKVHFPT